MAEESSYTGPVGRGLSAFLSSPPDPKTKPSGQRPSSEQGRGSSGSGIAPKALAEIDFTDIIVATGRGFSHGPRIRGLPGPGPGQRPLPPEFAADFANLQHEVEAARPDDKRTNYAVEWDGVRYRIQRSIVDKDGEVIFFARGMWPIPPLDGFRINPQVRKQLLNLGIGERSGLVLAVGPMRSGKTTFISSYVKSLVEQHSENALTLEDPTELKLQGQHGEGFIYQYEFTDETFEDLMAEALRSRVKYMMIGEIRTPLIAARVVRAALNGACIIASMHGGDIAQGLIRLANLAAAVDGEWARTALAEGLTAALHFSLTEIAGRRLVGAKALFTEPESSCAIRNIIRQDKMELINAVVQQQQDALASGMNSR